jgi:hypothetical protein
VAWAEVMGLHCAKAVSNPLCALHLQLPMRIPVLRALSRRPVA